MSDAFLAACAAFGLDPAEQRRVQANAALSRDAVSHSADLDRVLALPRREWEIGLGGRYGTADELVDALSQRYRRRPEDDHGRPVRLRSQQAVALAEIHDFGGALLPIRVGGGKTLISLLAPLVVAAERPLLLVRASLREKTVRDWRGYSADWTVPPLVVQGQQLELPGCTGAPLVVESYTQVGRVEGERILADLDPDLIIADEAHWLANQRAGVTRKVRRHIAEKGCRFVALSGTITKRSLKDYSHLAEWALDKLSPVPRHRGALLEWAAYLDEGVENRPSPGALVRLCDAEEQAKLLEDPVTTIRRAFGRRLRQTPGVVVVKGRGTSASLEVSALHVELKGREIEGAVLSVRDRWELPDGQPIADATSRWRHLRELSVGLYYRWKERPPEPWLEARRAWCAFVRHTIAHNRRGLDTELQVSRICSASRRLARAKLVLAEAGLDPGDATAVEARLHDAWALAGHPKRALEPGASKIQLTRRAVRELADPVLGAVLDYRTSIGVQPLADEGAWARWDDVRASFQPETEAMWVSEASLKAAAAWLERHKGLVWVDVVEFGARLSRETGVPYVRSGEMAAKVRLEETGGPAIVSIAACQEGLNLQKGHRSLVATPPRAGRAWEQMLGRQHRDGQAADTVICEVLIALPEGIETFCAALADAKYLQETTTEQRLCLADVNVDPPAKPGPLWR